MSGTTPSWSHAKVRPLRPRPAWISSAIISAFSVRQSSRTSARNPSGGITTPPSPWIGSSRTPTTSGPMAPRRASMSPYFTEVKPGVYGA